MKNLSKILALAASAVVLAVSVWAVVIEGTTPNGQFKAVGLDANGNFRVAVGTGTATHVVVDSTVTVAPAPGSSWVTVGSSNPLATPLVVSGIGGGPVTVSGSFTSYPSTAASVSTGQVAVPAFPANATILASNPSRKQATVCNISTGLTIWLGNGAVTTVTGIPLTAGSCMSPDTPSAFVGTLVGTSTGAATAAFIEYQ